MGLDVSLYATTLTVYEITKAKDDAGDDYEGLPDDIEVWSNAGRHGLWELYHFLNAAYAGDPNCEYVEVPYDLDELKETYVKELVQPNLFKEGLHHLKQVIDAIESHPGLNYIHHSWY